MLFTENEKERLKFHYNGADFPVRLERLQNQPLFTFTGLKVTSNFEFSLRTHPNKLSVPLVHEARRSRLLTKFSSEAKRKGMRSRKRQQSKVNDQKSPEDTLFFQQQTNQKRIHQHNLFIKLSFIIFQQSYKLRKSK